jgi:signal transduction histidine kinase
MKKLINSFKLDNKIWVGYIFSFLLLLLSYIITVYSNGELLNQSKLVAYNNNIIGELEKLVSKVKDAETGFRGFCVMKDSVFLEIYYSSRGEVKKIYDGLRLLVSNNTTQKYRLNLVDTLIKEKYDLIEWGILTFVQSDYVVTDEMKIKAYRGKKVMDDLRNTVDEMEADEKLLLSERSIELADKFRARNIVTNIFLTLVGIMIVFSFFLYRKENRGKQESEEKIRIYQQELQLKISDLRFANKELIEMRRQEKFAATGRIARTIAHEIRNPLTNINLGLEQLKTLAPATADSNILYDLVMRNSNRINQLITDLLQSTKFADLNYDEASINKLLDEALEQATDRISLNKIQVEKKYSTDICAIKVDKEVLRIAFLNIIVNAIEAMQPDKGVLSIQTKADNGKCWIEIKDNGSGMDKESLSKLFEPYFTKKPKGTGLGLTNTHNIILNHKGSIEVESELGKGSSFKISLDMS